MIATAASAAVAAQDGDEDIEKEENFYEDEDAY